VEQGRERTKQRRVPPCCRVTLEQATERSSVLGLAAGRSNADITIRVHVEGGERGACGVRQAHDSRIHRVGASLTGLGSWVPGSIGNGVFGGKVRVKGVCVRGSKQKEGSVDPDLSIYLSLSSRLFGDEGSRSCQVPERCRAVQDTPRGTSLSDAQNDQITFRLDPTQPAAADELRYCVYSGLFGIASKPKARSVSGKGGASAIKDALQ